MGRTLISLPSVSGSSPFWRDWTTGAGRAAGNISTCHSTRRVFNSSRLQCWMRRSKGVCTNHGNRDPHAAPHGVYPSRGEDQWCAIAVFNDNEWNVLSRAAEKPEWAGDPRFQTQGDRKTNEDQLDPLIAEWTSQFDAQAIMERLQSAGVRAGVVQSVPDLLSCPQLLHRNQLVRLSHPEFVQRISQPRYRLLRQPRRTAGLLDITAE